ncbi:hypothetical protein [Parabacteroides sp. FAFU027]|uniref:hypothetical protein n=1 Tax=Parabacteroides sp. FAFU027 TaxID=2922715 RepID=UPI001FAFA744|nr:hypothetical protein [Parabacteroides sp. FAFU027]
MNLYWPVYKNLEREIIELSNQVHFDDTQILIYSVKLSELLIRCSVEIEAIAKELYFIIGGIEPSDKDLFFDTDCIELLERKWLLSKKQVLVTSPNFYFKNYENKVLTPLNKANKRGTSGADWKRAYQAVKHHRTANLSKGNIKHLLRAMAALFLLNIYFRDEVFDLSDKNTDNFSKSLSELFDIKVHTWHGSTVEDSYIKHSDFDECVYLVKWTDEYNKKWNEFSLEHNKSLKEIIFNHPNVKKYINENLIENGKIKPKEFTSFISNREYFKCFDMKKEYGDMIRQAEFQASEKLNFSWRTAAKFEAIINKCQNIYPD